jgi:hypothetical protein
VSAIRLGQLYVADNRAYEVRTDPRSVHFPSQLAGLMRNLDHFAAVADLPASPYRLPMEPGEGDFAWADEAAGAVVVRRGCDRMYASLNWRHGFRGSTRSRENVKLNGIARVHLTTPQADRIANVAMQNPCGFEALGLLRYGPYVVAMNASRAKAWPLPADFEAVEGTDLVSRRPVRLAAGTEIAPTTTMVLHVAAAARAERAEAE